MEQKEERLKGPAARGTCGVSDAAPVAVAAARSTKLTFGATYSKSRHPMVVPTLRIQGFWLQDLGWDIGEQVIVDASRESIVISRVDGVEDPPGQAS